MKRTKDTQFNIYLSVYVQRLAPLTFPVLTFNISNFSLFHQPVNDEAPRIVTEQLFAYEGHAVTLTNSSFYISDLDTPPADLIFTIINEPRNGHLIKKDHNTTDNGSVLQEKSIFSYKVSRFVTSVFISVCILHITS